MQYYYQIAGIRILCEIPYPLQLQEESIPFLEETYAREEADVELEMIPVEEIEFQEEGGNWQICQYYKEGKEEYEAYFCPTREKAPYAHLIWQYGQPIKIRCYYRKQMEDYVNYSHNICDLMCLEQLLSVFQGIILHSSFIRYQDQAILFSAPSGTGKSTQADLWVKYEGAEILNGDRTGIRRFEDGWKACGLPYAGTSGIYRKENAPLKAIVVLRQAKENKIYPIRPVEAMRYLYPEILVHNWDKFHTERIMDLLTALVSEIPIYLLECLPDQGAVDLVKNTIF